MTMFVPRVNPFPRLKSAQPRPARGSRSRCQFSLETSVRSRVVKIGVLKESKVASYYLSEGEEVTVPQLSHLGSTFKEGKLAFKAVPLPQEMELEAGGKCGCARCDSSNLYCCPNPDECMGCGVCGSVCCKIRPGSD